MKRREGTRSIGRGGEDGEYEKGVQGLRGKGKNEKTRPREEKRRGGKQSAAGEKQARRDEEERCGEMDR